MSGRTSLTHERSKPLSTSKPIVTLSWQAGLFFLVFLGFQWLWLDVREGMVGHVVIDQLTVVPAVALIHFFTPDVNVQAHGTHIAAVGGGINVIFGCEGVEMMALLIAAMLVAPLTWRAKAVGLLIGLPYLYLLNQARLLTMFYAVRTDRAWFDLLHGTLAPIALIVMTVLFFAGWLAYQTKRQAHVSAD